MTASQVPGGMAAILAAHRGLPMGAGIRCCGRFRGWQAHAAHQATALTAAGYGDTTALLDGKCPTPCDDDCETRCHEGHQPTWRRGHQVENCEFRQQQYAARHTQEDVRQVRAIKGVDKHGNRQEDQ